MQLEVAQAQARAAHAEAKAEAGWANAKAFGAEFRPVELVFVMQSVQLEGMRYTFCVAAESWLEVLSELQESFQRNVPEMVPQPDDSRCKHVPSCCSVLLALVHLCPRCAPLLRQCSNTQVAYTSEYRQPLL